MSTAEPTACDVAIVGAGPAGSALALRLVERGRRVVVVDGDTFTGERIGESLAPDVQPLLRDLGVWTRFEATGPLASWGTKSVWSGASIDDHSHLIGPYGNGWHVDRRAYDEMLALAARDAGADLRLGSKVTGLRSTAGGWEITSADRPATTAAVLVDASGRSGRVGRMLGARRAVFDRLVGVGRTWRTAAAGTVGQWVLVEATAHGWWYSAPIPGDGVVTLLMTDADICRSERLTSPNAWNAALATAPQTAARVTEAAPRTRLRSHAALSSRAVRTEGEPWLAVGDAALSVDPLTGSGVLRALDGAAIAADAVGELLERPRPERSDVLRRYDARLDAACTRYLHERLDYYAAGPALDSAFWSRRRAVAARRDAS